MKILARVSGFIADATEDPGGNLQFSRGSLETEIEWFESMDNNGRIPVPQIRLYIAREDTEAVCRQLLRTLRCEQSYFEKGAAKRQASADALEAEMAQATAEVDAKVDTAIYDATDARDRVQLPGLQTP